MNNAISQETDPFVQFKAVQREGWASFAPLELITTPSAAKLVHYADVKAGEKVLDVGCGTGVVAVTAARRGASVIGLDLTPALLERAKENARIAEVSIEFIEGDAEALPFKDESFDVVLSQFGHMFAPRPLLAISEMLRVLKPKGRIAFSTWPPELYTGKMFALMGRYLPPPPAGAVPPPQWGDPNIIRERLGDKVTNLMFDRELMLSPGLSPRHLAQMFERTAGPIIKLVQLLKDDQPRLAQFRKELEEDIVAPYFKDNQLHQQFLMTRAIKK